MGFESLVRILLILLVSFQISLGDHNSSEAVVGSFNWHYSSENTVMKEGHRKIREWREQIREERLNKLSREIFQSAPRDPVDVIPPPVPLGTEHTFAEGRVKGKWRLNFVTNQNSDGGYGAGVRLDRTVYNPNANKIYALTTESNLFHAVLEHGGAWELRNQIVQIAKKGFTGIQTPSGVFRLIASINNIFHYSDDEGLSWVESAGGTHDRNAVYWAESMENGDVLAHIRKRVGNSTQDVLIRSTDYGQTFTDVQAWSSATGTLATKLYNTVDHVIVVRPSGGSWTIYSYENGSIRQLTSFSASQTPSTITGTSYQGGVHVYVGTSSGGYYTDDGESWQYRSTIQRSLETVHPSQPGFLFSRTPQHEYTTNGGQSWQIYSGNDNTIGWDPKHLTYYKVNGEWTFVGANDMGLCFNADPLNRNTWQYTNKRHSYAILHGGVAVDHTNLTVTANQDPGTYELVRTGTGTYEAINRQSADGLRVAASNNGTAYWYRHYWESWFHSNASFSSNTGRKVSYNMPGDWYTPPFKGSTTPGEDAIYVSGHANLVKLTYNQGSNNISRTNLPYNFQSNAGGITYGVGVTKADPNRIYVATRNGRFFYSTNAGQSWTETSYAGNSPTPQTSPEYNQSTGFYIEVADTDPNLVFWGGGTGSSAVLISRDGGRTFTSSVQGLPSNERVGTISLSPDGKLAFSSNYYMYVEATNHWYDLKAESMPSGSLPYAQGVNYLPLQRKVRYFTWGAGVMDLDVTYLNTQDYPAVTLPPSSCYEIRAVHSGKSLTVAGAATQDGANIQQSTWAATDNQRWQLQLVDGFYWITNIASQKVLSVAGESIEEGANVEQATWLGTDFQKWNVVANGVNQYAIVSKSSVKALAVSGSSTAEQANVQQSTYFENTNQLWTLIEDPTCAAVSVEKKIEGKPNLLISASLSGVFNIEYKDEKKFEIEIFTLSGIRVKKVSRSNYVDLSSEKPGIYYFKIKGADIAVTKQVMLF